MVSSFWTSVFENVQCLPEEVVAILAENCVNHGLLPLSLNMLTADLLKELGVSKIGHRLAILKDLEMLCDFAKQHWAPIAPDSDKCDDGARRKSMWKQHRQYFIDSREVELGDKLGAGSFGVVYYGECRGKEVAVKKLLDVSDSGFRKFQDEISLISSVPHPNVCMFMGLVVEPPMLLSAYEAGGSVQSLLDNAAVDISETCASRIGAQVALGMNWLHSRSPPLLHLDLKPANFLLSRPSPAADVKICDFGLSSLLSEGGSLKDVGVHGTLPYLSPERLRLEAYGKSADVYSFAVAMWQIFSRQEPFSALLDEAELYAANQASLNQRRQKRSLINDVLGYMAKKIGAEHVRPSTRHLSSSVVYMLRRYWHSDPAERPPFSLIAEEMGFLTVQSIFGPHETAACEFWCQSFRRRLSVPFSWFRMELLDSAELWITGKSLDCFKFFLEEASQVGVGAPEPATTEADGEKHVTAAGFALLLSCFGPWTMEHDGDGAVKTNFHSIVATFMDLCQFRIGSFRPFFGVLDSKQAKSILKNCAANTWMIRVSTRFAEHPFVISQVDDQQRVTHQRIKHFRDSHRYAIDVVDNKRLDSDRRPLVSKPDKQSLVQFLQEVTEVVQLDRPARGSPFDQHLSPNPTREDSYVSVFDVKTLLNEINQIKE